MKDIEAQRRKGRMLSALFAILCMVVAMVSARAGREQSYQLEAYPEVSVQEVQEAYEASKEVDDLVYLLKVLCYQAEVENNSDVETLIAEYGSILLDMAKREEINLKEMDDEEETLLELLRLIREHGAS